MYVLYEYVYRWGTSDVSAHAAHAAQRSSSSGIKHTFPDVDIPRSLLFMVTKGLAPLVFTQRPLGSRLVLGLVRLSACGLCRLTQDGANV